MQKELKHTLRRLTATLGQRLSLWRTALLDCLWGGAMTNRVKGGDQAERLHGEQKPDHHHLTHAITTSAKTTRHATANLANHSEEGSHDCVWKGATTNRAASAAGKDQTDTTDRPNQGPPREQRATDEQPGRVETRGGRRAGGTNGRGRETTPRRGCRKPSPGTPQEHTSCEETGQTEQN